MLINHKYNRRAAFFYAARWWNDRNPKYYDFADIGGDCTNFISQCVFAGSGVMNYTPTFGWYFQNLHNRTASWTGVEYFYNFMIANTGDGPHMSVVDISQIQIGDIIQLGDMTGSFFHSLFVTDVGRFPSESNILVATHSFDEWMRPLDSYGYNVARFLHVNGVNMTI